MRPATRLELDLQEEEKDRLINETKYERDKWEITERECNIRIREIREQYNETVTQILLEDLHKE